MVFSSKPRSIAIAAATAFGLILGGASVQAEAQLVAFSQASVFSQALAAAASANEALSNFYGSRGYTPLWTGPQDAARRQLLLTALDSAPRHGLPVARYDAAALRARFRNAVTEGDRGRLEVAMTAAYLAFAHDLSSGVLVPSKIDPTILREITPPAPALLLARASGAGFARFLHDLPPTSPEYARMMKEKFLLEAKIAEGGFGPGIPAGTVIPGDSGAAVVALRDRLVALGYLNRSATRIYDRAVQSAVQRFQLDNGLTPDGSAGPGTVTALNTEPQDRLKSVIVAMERLRWMGDIDLGARHIWVNQPDFTAQIVDNGLVTFQTRAVIGRQELDRRTPEFSDLMEFMVINPSWSVPRSITTKEYLPMLRANPNAVSHLQVIDGAGRVVPRGAVNFADYSDGNFPFALRQPPSDGNALGKVKFMFPNPNNIYLHDTPSKSLFDEEVRAFSHGCIRLADPRDFAYVLLARQSDDPKAEFQHYLETGRESRLDLATPVPVHLVYFTAWPNAKGQMTYRRDVYGRDAEIYQALENAGMVLELVQG